MRCVKKTSVKKWEQDEKAKKNLQEHKNWTMEQWTKVLWADESKFQFFESQRQHVRRRKTETYKEPCLNPTIKHGGGSIQVWGAYPQVVLEDLVNRLQQGTKKS